MGDGRRTRTASPRARHQSALSTLADVRDLVGKHVPEQYRRKPTWRHVSTEIAKAAEGEKDLLEICVSLRRSAGQSPPGEPILI